MMNKVFLFHTGSIKSLWARVCVLIKEPFLFHTGSIKSPSSIHSQTGSRTFLFHTGSIKRETFRHLLRSRHHGFYSILVRLKEDGVMSILDPMQSFYSILVRLKGKSNHSHKRTAQNEFLFHTGSIKRSSFRSKPCAEYSFYSILVRLKGRCAYLSQYRA